MDAVGATNHYPANLTPATPAIPSGIISKQIQQQPLLPAAGTCHLYPLAQRQIQAPSPAAAASPIATAAPEAAANPSTNLSSGALLQPDRKRTSEKRNIPLLNQYKMSHEQIKQKQAQIEQQRREKLKQDILTARKDAKDSKSSRRSYKNCFRS